MEKPKIENSSTMTEPIIQPLEELIPNLHGLSLSTEPKGQESHLNLVHLLLACAQAIERVDYISAKEHLNSLNQQVSPLGSSVQRVVSYFTEALRARLGISAPSTHPYPRETLKAYQTFYQACPYVKFGHFTANQMIFEAFEGEERVHIIDLDIRQGYQWPALLQALSARPCGPPFVTITGIGYPPESVREIGHDLTQLAKCLHVPFQFHSIEVLLQDLKPGMLVHSQTAGVALAVNSVNSLHQVENLVEMIRNQAPKIVTLVEQEASHYEPCFFRRFVGALHYYLPVFDSLADTFPVDSERRREVEQYILAPEIRNIVACDRLERVQRDEKLDNWRKIMEEHGFYGVRPSANAVTQSKILLDLYGCDKYRLIIHEGCLLLGWLDRAVTAVSAWRC